MKQRGRSRRKNRRGKNGLYLAVLAAGAVAVGAGGAVWADTAFQEPGDVIEASLAQESGGVQTGESLSGEESVSAAEESVSAAAEESIKAAEESTKAAEESTKAAETSSKAVEENSESAESGSGEESASAEEVKPGIFRSEREFSTDYVYGEFSAIHTGKAAFYDNRQENRKGITVCVNAGHGCSGGETKKTYCHLDEEAMELVKSGAEMFSFPGLRMTESVEESKLLNTDKTPKVTSGTTAAGAVKSSAISSGMTFSDGTPEAEVTLRMALILRDRLLEEGYSVLMVRETEDSQLDNVARTVMANNLADCHIALHWDSTASDKGVFFMSVPSAASYRSMEPVASHWEDHNRLGKALVDGLKGQGAKVFGNGEMEMDLTQTSFSTVPSVDIELGDKASDHGEETLRRLADGLTDGVNQFFGTV